jgi:two-component system sensor histidine kinase/response regulator
MIHYLMDMAYAVMSGQASQRSSLHRAARYHHHWMTAGVFDEEADQKRVGCDDFLRKPFRPADITDLLAKHLGVRFIYQRTARRTPARPMQAAAYTLGLQRLGEQPAAWREQLRQAATTANADQIRPIDPGTINRACGYVE